MPSPFMSSTRYARHTHSVAVLVQTKILDAGAGESTTAPTTVAGTRSGLIGRVVLGECALRLPGPADGPPCKVLELPIELPASTTRTAGNARRGQVSSGVSGRRTRPGTIILFLERVTSPPPRPRSSQDAVVSSLLQHGAPSNQTMPATAAAVAAIACETAATVAIDIENKDAGSASTTDARAPATQTWSEGGSQQQAQVQPRPSRPPARGKMQLKVFSAWGLSRGAKALDVVVTVMACGRGIGTTRVSSIGGTTSPEWIDEQ